MPTGRRKMEARCTCEILSSSLAEISEIYVNLSNAFVELLEYIVSAVDDQPNMSEHFE